jgi:thioredoxin 1
MTETPSEPRSLDPEGFEAFVAEHDLVLLDVWAEWCGPCKELEPVVADLAAELDDVAVAKVDNEAHPEFAEQYRSLLGRVISGLPALFVFEEGEVVERLLGKQSKDDLRSAVDPYR